MTKHRGEARWRGSCAPKLAHLALAALAGTAGACKKDEPAGAPPVETPPAAGPGKITGLSAEAQAVPTPFDATPSPDGSTLYFTALGGEERGGVLYRATSAAPEIIASGFVAPLSLVSSTDGQSLYVADAALAAEPANPPGLIQKVAVAGGAKTEVPGTAGYQPRGLDLRRVGEEDVLYFTGVAPADGQPGVWRVTGGRVELVFQGEPLRDPSGVAVSSTGEVYLSDTTGGTDARGSIVRITGGVATVVLEGLRLGYPAGITLSPDEKVLLASGLQQESASALVYRITLADGTYETVSDGISGNSESAGLHKAHAAPVGAWADGSELGTVYRLRFD